MGTYFRITGPSLPLDVDLMGTYFSDNRPSLPLGVGFYAFGS